DMAGPPACRARVISTAIAPYLDRAGPIGRVHSVFRAAINVELADQLVTVATPSVGVVPNGLVVDASAVDVFSTASVAPGTPVWRSGRALDLHQLRIELDGAELWSPRLTRRGEFRPLAQVRAPLARALQRQGTVDGFSPLFFLLTDEAPDAALPMLAARAYPAIRDLVRSFRRDDLGAATAAARQLVGLGDGLTPSGDDFLIGFGAALRAMDHPLHSRFATACANLAAGRTTTVAETFHRFAADCAYSARIHRVVASLTDPAADLRNELELALAWGASSGADCLLGLLLGGDSARTRAQVGAL
ncbi:MAG TPA: DUF2877 domain-containing protein, partial [Chloroflexota bacterium]|nr:DUF2877 domain-containing protein [Chloroflexota bacterium]